MIRVSANVGYSILKRGGSSIDAVEEAIKVMENSDIFNAGSGSSLTIEGKVQPDAAIMNGDLSCGGVGDAGVAKNPISLARAVMERSDHVLIVGSENLNKFARAIKYPLYNLVPSEKRKKEYRIYLSQMRKNQRGGWQKNLKLLRSYEKIGADGLDTVGAVAVDKRNHVAAGVSTGGRFLKLPGRIGDSAIIGSGLYADASAGAASATGIGEDIIRVNLSKSVCDLMKSGADAQTACDTAIDLMSKARGSGTAGVIAVDLHGGFGFARNTEMMSHALRTSDTKQTYVTILPEEENGNSLSRFQKKLRP